MHYVKQRLQARKLLVLLYKDKSKELHEIALTRRNLEGS